jgi:hypothetical protein
MADNKIYLGRPGAYVTLRAPRGTLESTRARRIATFELGVGGTAVDQMVGGARAYTINYEQLFREDFAVLQAFLDGHEGPGPFVLFDPAQRNMLPANISAATSVTNGIDGGPTGGFVLYGAAETFNRAPVASGFGTSTSNAAWTVSGGSVANYAATGTSGTMTVTSTGVERTASLTGLGPNFDIIVYFKPGVVATGAQLEGKIRYRYSGGSTFYETNVQLQTDGTVTLYMVRNVTVLSGLPSALTYNANSVIGIHIQAIGSTLRHKIWDQTLGNEPSAWTYSTTDATFPGTTSDSLYLVANRITSNSNSNWVATWGSVSVAALPTLTSSAAYTDAGPRVLTLTFGSVGPAVIGMDWPSSTFPYGVPVVPGRAICFSCWVRGGGGDPIVTYTPRIIWRSATGAIVSTTSGTPVASASGAFAQMFATGTLPAGALYADFDIQYTSGASVGSVGYFRRFMLNEGSTPDTTWVPGTGVWPVRLVSMTEAWPFLSPELRASPVAVFTEDVS